MEKAEEPGFVLEELTDHAYLRHVMKKRDHSKVDFFAREKSLMKYLNRCDLVPLLRVCVELRTNLAFAANRLGKQIELRRINARLTFKPLLHRTCPVMRKTFLKNRHDQLNVLEFLPE